MRRPTPDDDAAAARPRGLERLMRPAAVWCGFAVVHLYFLGWMASFFLHGWAFSDTEQYREWAMAGYNAPVEGSVSPWVYPVLAQPFILLPRIMGHDLYLLGWTLMITVLDAVALWFLLHRAHRPAAWELPGPRGGTPDPGAVAHGSSAVLSRRRAAVVAGWWWVVFTVFMGYLSFARVEGVAAPIVFIGLLHAVRHPVVGSALLSVATWIKVWPAATVLAMVIALRQRVRIVVTGVVVSAAVVAGVLVLGGIDKIADFALNQGSRGMQLEATLSTPWVWAAVLGIGGSRIADNTAINSTEVYGPGVETMASLMQPLLLVAVLASALLLVRALRRGADRGRLVYAGSLLLTLVLIVFNKVGSPQFMIWLAPVIMVGLLRDRVRWRTPALLTLGIVATTFVIYPLFYTPLIHANPVMAAVLTTRNALLVALLVWTVRRIWRLGSRAAVDAADLGWSAIS
ncbi:hypothetical protein OH817_09125 [Kocuria rhizophila]|uniref:hypothetical protein n=1 Tax=Kocuria rhizophila TaxID=72000 RepID=UPI002ED578FB|nr:hypothetical protein OH817_09125 [Kocuria rhizophila]